MRAYGAAQSHSASLDNLPGLALGVYDRNVVLQLGVGIFVMSLAANKVHLLMLGGLKQDLGRDNAGVAKRCGGLGEVVTGFDIWVEAEGFGTLNTGSSS